MAKAHISYSMLIDYAAGMLPAAEAAAVDAHLKQSPADALTVARYRMVQQRLAGDDSIEPSAAAVARAKAIFQQKAAARASWLDVVDRFIARLIFDSRVDPVAVRYADATERINLAYRAESAEIDLQAERLAEIGGVERWRIMGQVSGAGQPARVALATRGTSAAVAEVAADPHGQFTLETSPGAYDLYIEFPKGVLVIPDLEIT